MERRNILLLSLPYLLVFIAISYVFSHFLHALLISVMCCLICIHALSDQYMANAFFFFTTILLLMPLSTANREDEKHSPLY